MDLSEHFDTYLNAELESDRCKAINRFTECTDQTKSAHTHWSLLAMLPSRIERVQLANSLGITSRPNGNWTVCSYLLKDPEQDVVGNAINSMTRSRVRSFAHRAFHYYRSPERPQRILYCLARYCEEANDRRIAEQVAPTLASDLSDAYLARSFNALYKHGIKSEAALRVATELVESHIDATNMDRKAAVSAIAYIFFAGSMQDIQKMSSIKEKVTIPELRRLLNWGLQEISQLHEQKNSITEKLSPEMFWQRNLFGIGANYTGYGCFSSEELLSGLKSLDSKNNLPELTVLTERILNLGNLVCTNWLASHKTFGLREITGNNRRVMNLWKEHATQNTETFSDFVISEENAEFWHSESPELIALNLDPLVLVNSEEKLKSWIKTARTLDKKMSLNILLGIILAVENSVMNKGIQENQFAKVIHKVCDELEKTSLVNNDKADNFNEIILGCLIGTPLSDRNLQEICLKSLNAIGWWDLGITFLHNWSDLHLSSMLKRFENSAKDAADEKQILVTARTAALAILNARERSGNEALQKSIHNFSEIMQVLDPNNNVSPIQPDPEQENSESDDHEQNVADWSGHFVIDRPIAKWGTVIEVLFKDKLHFPKNTLEADGKNSKLLTESLRTANHVEKRWIARALASLATDDAVKTLLYQGLQHIDSEFVAHTIRELLPSAHPRAQQALIRCVGRNVISDDLKLHILEEMNISNPTEILQELKTLEILRLPQHIDDAIRDAVGRVASAIDEKESLKARENEDRIVRLDGQDVDSLIRSMLPNQDQLNVDSRSALRTAEMILIQSQGWTQGGMDLSPIVNMHCKAVELVLRDCFEPYTDALLRKGQLSRKLDLLGYARPIPEKMQVFEDTLASLPVIKTIPYFSKFKLRKMLRGICLFRPGKRFTLDGPKAFALFFLVTSRQTCSFGLENILSLGFSSDKELFEYIKLIHSLQDSRNRAVHEGLTWEAKDEIESMRAQAFKTIEISLRIKKYLSSMQTSASSISRLGMGA